MAETSSYPISIATSTSGVQLHCTRCATTEVLLLDEQAIAQHVPPFLDQHPNRCLPATGAGRCCGSCAGSSDASTPAHSSAPGR